MRKYENDTELKIPSWIMKLPMWALDLMCAVGEFLNRIFHRKRNNKLDQCETKFYL